MSLMATYNQPPVTFVRGEGVHLYDEKGRQYLDFVSGVAVNALGHCHPAVTEAIARQSTRLVHTSNLFRTQPASRLADRLCELLGWPDGKVFFGNSGAEANECALKLARKWSRVHFGADRFNTIAAFGSFHGRTLATLAATGQPRKWGDFAPMPGGFMHVPYDDPHALESAIDGSVCSVLLEPVLGEAGVVIPSAEYLPSVRKLCDAHDLLYMADEVQTGLGRTGEWFAFQSNEAVPDVITLAKALGNGLPIGACVARGSAGSALQKGDHGSTLGGGPLVAEVALAVLDTIDKDNLVVKARRTGEYLAAGLRLLSRRFAEVGEIRSKGLMLAVELTSDIARKVADAALDEGLLVNDVTPSAIRLLPPLIVAEPDCDNAVKSLEQALVKIEGSKK